MIESQWPFRLALLQILFLEERGLKRMLTTLAWPRWYNESGSVITVSLSSYLYASGLIWGRQIILCGALRTETIKSNRR